MKQLKDFLPEASKDNVKVDVSYNAATGRLTIDSKDFKNRVSVKIPEAQFKKLGGAATVSGVAIFINQ